MSSKKMRNSSANARVIKEKEMRPSTSCPFIWKGLVIKSGTVVNQMITPPPTLILKDKRLNYVSRDVGNVCNPSLQRFMTAKDL